MDTTFSITDGWVTKVVVVVIALAVVALMIGHVVNSIAGSEEVHALRGANAGHVLSPAEAEALARVQRP